VPWIVPFDFLMVKLHYCTRCPRLRISRATHTTIAIMNIPFNLVHLRGQAGPCSGIPFMNSSCLLPFPLLSGLSPFSILLIIVTVYQITRKCVFPLRVLYSGVFGGVRVNFHNFGIAIRVHSAIIMRSKTDQHRGCDSMLTLTTDLIGAGRWLLNILNILDYPIKPFPLFRCLSRTTTALWRGKSHMEVFYVR